MDIARPDIARRKKRRRIRVVLAGVTVISGVSLALWYLKPPAPSVKRSSVWIDVVKRGPLLYQVGGNGILVPEEIRWITAGGIGRVERILMLPGVTVAPDKVLVELSNPDLEQETLEAESSLKSAEATTEELKVRLETERLTQEI